MKDKNSTLHRSLNSLGYDFARDGGSRNIYVYGFDKKNDSLKNIYTLNDINIFERYFIKGDVLLDIPLPDINVNCFYGYDSDILNFISEIDSQSLDSLYKKQFDCDIVSIKLPLEGKQSLIKLTKNDIRFLYSDSSNKTKTMIKSFLNLKNSIIDTSYEFIILSIDLPDIENYTCKLVHRLH